MKIKARPLFGFFTLVGTVGLLLWGWLMWKNSNPAIVAFGPPEPALAQLRWALAKRVLSGIAIFGLWFSGVFGLYKTRKTKTDSSLPQRQLGG
jgi:predicted MFS family arabinose efflux permease